MRPLPKPAGLTRSFTQIPFKLLSHLRRNEAANTARCGAEFTGTAPAALPGDNLTSRGNYLLEFAAVLVALTPVVFGAIDINSALQGYNAVRESADTAARCLYPTDAGCTNASTYTDVGQFYDWYQDANITKFRPEKSDYAGKARWATRPTYTWDTFAALAYTSASYQIPMTNYQRYEPGVERGANMAMAVETKPLPTVSESTAADSARNPAVFTLGGTDLADDPAAANRFKVLPNTPSNPDSYSTGVKFFHPLGSGGCKNPNGCDLATLPNNVRRVTLTTNESVALEGTVPNWVEQDWFKFLRTFKGISFGSSTPNLNYSCVTPPSGGNGADSSACMRDSANRFRVAFWLNARFNTPGGATLELEYLRAGSNSWQVLPASSIVNGQGTTVLNNQGQPAGLGGQVSGADINGAFDPRGFLGLGGSNWSRTPSSNAAIYVPADTVRIRVRVTATGEGVNVMLYLRQFDATPYDYNGSAFFLPDFAEASLAASCKSCAEGATSCNPVGGGGTFGNGSGLISYVSTITEAQNAPGTQVLANNLSTTVHNEYVGAMQAHPSVAVANANMQGTTSYGCPYSIHAMGAAAPATVTLNCPKDSQGFFYGKQNICRQQVEPNVPQEYRNSLTFGSTSVTAPQGAYDTTGNPNWSFSWSKDTCASNYAPANFTAPAGLTARYDVYYPPTSVASAATTTYSDITSLNGADPNGPAGAPYACADFPKRCALYDALPSGSQAPADCPLVSPLPSGVTSSMFNGLQNRLNSNQAGLTTALRQEALNLGMPSFQFLEPVATDVVTSNDDSLYALTCPGSNIVCATKVFTEGTTLIASNIPEGTVPPACAGNTCYTRLSSVNGQGASGVSTDVAAAASIGRQEFMAAFSRANFTCPEGSTERDCAWVSATQIGDEVEVTTRLNVPFYFLGTGTRQMSHTQRRKLERSYVQ